MSNDLILAKSGGFVKLQKNIASQIVWQLFLNGSHNFYNHMSGREMINLLGRNCVCDIYSYLASRFRDKNKHLVFSKSIFVRRYLTIFSFFVRSF